MNLLKRIINITLIAMGFLLIIIVSTMAIDGKRTDYLKVDKHEIAHTDSYLITKVNIIPMNQDTVFQNKMVSIKEGIIDSIADRIDVQGLDVIDGKNGYLLPGLIDMHVHVWDKYELGLYLSSGVTAIRNVWGMPMHLRLKKQIKQGTILSPMFYTTGPKLTGPEFIGDDNLQLFSPDEARERIQDYKYRGYDFIKTYYGLPRDIFDAVVEQAKITEMDIVAHPSQMVPYNYHFNKQIASLEHAEDIVQQPLQYQLDSLKLQEVISGFSGAPHTSFSPTLIAYYNIYTMLTNKDILNSELVQYMNPAIKMLDSKAQFDRWHSAIKEDPNLFNRIRSQHNFHLYIIKKLHETGVNLICGTDAGIGVTAPGHSIHQEFQLYKEAGLSNYEVLQTATVNPSKVHQIMNNMGTIEIGKIANMILIKDNPLEDLSGLQRPDELFIKGKRLSSHHLDNFRERAGNRRNFIPTVVRYAENRIVEK